MINPFAKVWLRKNVKMTKEIVDYINDRKTLRQWAHLTLRE